MDNRLFFLHRLKVATEAAESSDVRLRSFRDSLRSRARASFVSTTDVEQIPVSAAYLCLETLLRRRVSDALGTAGGDGTKPDTPIAREALWLVQDPPKDKRVLGPLKDDLHPFVRQLLGEDRGLAREPVPDASFAVDKAMRLRGAFREIPVLHLSAHAVTEYQGSFGQGGKGTLLTLGKRASERLRVQDGARAQIRLKLEGLALQFFGTGIGYAVIQVQCLEPEKEEAASAAAVLEALHWLSHPARKIKRSDWVWANESLRSSDCPNYREILAALLADTGVSLEDTDRIFTYSCLTGVAANDLDALKLQGTRLACRYTPDYAVEPDGISVQRFMPFTNVLHTMSVEGGSVLVGETTDIEHLDNFRGAVRTSYLPLVLLALHERDVLLDISQSVGRFEVHRDVAPEVEEQLKLLHRRLVQFHLEYRFAVASLLSLHNQVHLRWRAAMDLDQLLAHAAEDVGEGEKVLVEQLDTRTRRRKLKWEVVAAGFGSMYLALQVCQAISAHFYDSNGDRAIVRSLTQVEKQADKQAERNKVWSDYEGDESRKDLFENFAAGACLLIGVLAAGVTWRSGSKRG